MSEKFRVHFPINGGIRTRVDMYREIDSWLEKQGKVRVGHVHNIDTVEEESGFWSIVFEGKARTKSNAVARLHDYAANTWGVAPTICTWLALKVAAVLIYIEASVRDFG